MKKWLIFLLFITVSISAKELFFFDNLYFRWLSASHFELINKNLNLTDSITKPAGTWQTLGAVIVNNSNFSKHKDCLYYYIPLGTRPGILKVKFLRIEQQCEDFLHEEGNLSLDNIYNLGLEINEDYGKDFNFRIKVDENAYAFKFPNFTKQDFIAKKLNSSVVGSNFRGITLGVPLNTLQETRVKLPDGEICFDVNDECEATMNFRCDQCENSSFPVVATSCKTKYRQVCGPNLCGSKDAPACIRGWSASGYKLEYCINDSPIGFCNEGLRVICFDGQLICK